MNQAPNAEEALESGASDAADDNAENEGGNGTFFIPSDILAGKDYKAGDTITLEVVGTDEDGDTEVKMAGGGSEGEGWQSDLKSSLAAADQGGQ